MMGWVAKLGPNRGKLASFSVAQVRRRRPAPTGSGCPTPATASAPNGQYVTGNDPNDANVPVRRRPSSRAGSSTSSARWGTARAAAACATTCSTTSRASGTPRIATCTRPAPTMDEVARQDRRLRRRDQGRRPRRAGRRARRSGAGAATSTAATTSSTAAGTAGAHLPDRAAHGGMDYLPWLLDQLRQRDGHDRPAAARRLHACTTIRRAASSATTSRPRCSCCATARRARCGIRTTSTRRWISDAACS